MLLLSVIVAGWIWSRVLTDCAGNPDPAVEYRIMATTRINVYDWCVDDQGQVIACLRSVPDLPVLLETIPDPGIGTDAGWPIDPIDNPELLPTPPVGGLVAWPWPSPENPYPVVAVDAAGNLSGVCP